MRVESDPSARRGVCAAVAGWVNTVPMGGGSVDVDLGHGSQKWPVIIEKHKDEL